MNWRARKKAWQRRHQAAMEKVEEMSEVDLSSGEISRAQKPGVVQQSEEIWEAQKNWKVS